MIEAYTIGIRLALDDGVSSHINAIRQDLTMIDRAVQTSGTRVRDLVRLGRELVVPEKSAQVEAHRENIAPVAQERTIGGADRRPPELSSDRDHSDDKEHATLRERTASRVVREPEIALVSQPPGRPAVSMAPRDDGRPVKSTPVKANRAQEMTGGSASDRQLTNLAELGRAISPTKALVLPPGTSPPIVEMARDWPARPKAITLVTATADQVHHRPHTAPGLRPPTASSAGVMAAPTAPKWKATTVRSDPVPQPGSIAPAGSVASPPRQMPAQPQWPSMAPAGRPALASEATIPAPPVSGGAAEPDRIEPSASQESAHGELIIDGLTIGRWISDHLADRVVRPHSGFSGMDPRLSPAWPGVVSSG